MLLWTIYIKSVALYQLSYLVLLTRAGLEPATNYCSIHWTIRCNRVGFEPTTYRM